MRETISAEELITVLGEVCDAVEGAKDYLCELDAAIGDGDHGISMARGFRAVKAGLPSKIGEDVSSILKFVGMTIVSNMGGAMGPLLGTAFIRAGETAQGKREIDLKDIVVMFQAAEKGVRDRGKAQPGDKTMLDTIIPAVEALANAAAQELPLMDAAKVCVAAAEKGMKSTAQMRAQMGRASRLADRTIGHPDAGATSSYVILKAAYDALEKMR